MSYVIVPEPTVETQVRLAELVNAVERLGWDHFDMNKWAARSDGRAQEIYLAADVIDLVMPDCGTAACIGGTAAACFHDELVAETGESEYTPSQVARFVGLPSEAFYTGDWHRVEMPMEPGKTMQSEFDRMVSYSVRYESGETTADQVRRQAEHNVAVRYLNQLHHDNSRKLRQPLVDAVNEAETALWETTSASDTARANMVAAREALTAYDRAVSGRD